MHYSAVFVVVRCPSVHLSITFVHCIQTAEDIVKHLSRPGSPMILIFFSTQAPILNSKGTPSAPEPQANRNCDCSNLFVSVDGVENVEWIV